MSTIEMSPDLVSNFTYMFMDNGNASQSNATFATGGKPFRGMLCAHAQSDGETGARFLLMKGAVPTAFNALTSVSVRSADILAMWDCTYVTSTNNIDDFVNSQTTVNPMILSSLYVNAIASGTATWFWWFTQTFGGGSAYTNDGAHPPISQIIGTVGTTGSGADLELPSVSIVATQPYRVFNFRAAVPTSWTY